MTVTPGSPVWIDLGTSEVERSMRFYRELFGWNFTGTGPDFGGYKMIDAGVAVGGLGPNMGRDGQLDPSLPQWWTVYLKVVDIDATLEAVAANGGTVVVPPMQIGDMGSMGIITAPSGAALGVWQADSFPGFDTEGRVGTSTWFESLTKDFAADAAFYAAVFGWENAPMADEHDASQSDEFPDAQDNGGGYVTNFSGDAATAGLCEANDWLPDEVPSYWRVYFRVDDTDDAIARIVELGGSLLDGPIDSPFGRVATVADPLGGAFQLIG